MLDKDIKIVYHEESNYIDNFKIKKELFDRTFRYFISSRDLTLYTGIEELKTDNDGYYEINRSEMYNLLDRIIEVALIYLRNIEEIENNSEYTDFVQIIEKYFNYKEDNKSWNDFKDKVKNACENIIDDIYFSEDKIIKTLNAVNRFKEEIIRRIYIKELTATKDDILKNLKYFVEQDIINSFIEKYEKALQEENIEMMKSILQDVQKLILDHWKEYINTDLSSYKQGVPFKFIIHSMPYGTSYEAHKFRDNYMSCSLITNEIMDTYREGFGFIFAPSNIAVARSNDQYINNRAESEDDMQTSLIRKVDSPERLIEECKQLKYENEINMLDKSVYNEVAIDVRSGCNPIGIFCITYGDKEINTNYKEALELKKKNPSLEIIVISKPLYQELTMEEKISLIKEIEYTSFRDVSKIDDFISNEEFLKRNEYFLEHYFELIKKDDYTKEDIIDLYQKCKKIVNDKISDSLDNYTDEEIRINLDFNYRLNNIYAKYNYNYAYFLDNIIWDYKKCEDYDRLDRVYDGLGTFIKLGKMYDVYKLKEQIKLPINFRNINQLLIDKIVEQENTQQSELEKLNSQLDSAYSHLGYLTELLHEKEEILNRVKSNNEIIKLETKYSIVNNQVLKEEDTLRQNETCSRRLDSRESFLQNDITAIDTEIEELSKHSIINFFKIKHLNIFKINILDRINEIQANKLSISKDLEHSKDIIIELKKQFFEETGINFDEYMHMLLDAKEFNYHNSDIVKDLETIKKDIEDIHKKIDEILSKITLKKEESQIIDSNLKYSLFENGYDINPNLRKKSGYIKVSLLILFSISISLTIIILSILIENML